MRTTATDVIAGLKFLKLVVKKTDHRACQYFHFTPNRMWVYDGEHGAVVDARTGVTGRVLIPKMLELIDAPDGLMPFYAQQDFVVPLETDCPFPTDSQLPFIVDDPDGISAAFKQCMKEMLFPSWMTEGILLGEHGLFASDGESKFIHHLRDTFHTSSGDAAVVPTRFAALVGRFGDPATVRANSSFIKASYPNGRHIFCRCGGVINSNIFKSTESLAKFGERQSSAFILDGKVNERACCKCALSYQCQLKHNLMRGEGASNAIMFVGKHPGRDDDSIGRPMTGPNGALFWELLLAAGFQQGEAYVTNCIKCAPITRNAGKMHWNACKSHLVQEIEQIRPKMIVAVGAEATEFLTGRTGVLGLRGTGLTCILNEDYTVYPIRQPMLLEHTQAADRAALKQSMVEDLRLVRDILYKGGKVSVDKLEDVTDYRVAATTEDVDAFLAELELAPELSCDIETNDTLDYNDPNGEIVSIGFSSGPGMGRAFPLKAPGVNDVSWWPDAYLYNVLIPKLRDFCQRKKVFGHNFLKFDCPWLRKKWGIDLDHVEFDTLLGSYAAFHGLKSYGLEVLANSKCGMRNWKKEFDSKDTYKLGMYLCKDVDATFRLKKYIEENIDELELWLLKTILIPVARELSYMEEKGVCIDREQVDSLDVILRGKRDACLQGIRGIQEVVMFEMENGCDFNPESSAQVGDIMFNRLRLPIKKKTKGKKPSVDAEVMEEYALEHPFAADVLQYKKLGKLHGTYVQGVLKRLVDNVLHTSYLEHRTVTGRLASQNPNLQNIPREDTVAKVLDDGSDIKRMFKPRPGYCFLQGDFSQIELRVLSCVAKDIKMMELFNSGADIHRETAAQACGIPADQVTKAQRTGAKFLNFGIVYGMTLPTLERMFEEAGTSAAEAQRFWTGHQKMFPSVWRYMTDQEQKVIRDGQQTTYFGRTRVYESKDQEAFRQAYNFPIQSMASDLTLLAIIQTGKVLRQMQLPAHPILTVHDSIIFEVDLDRFWDVCHVVKTIMESVSFPWIKVPIKVDLQAGPSWGDLLNVDIEKKILCKEK